MLCAVAIPHASYLMAGCGSCSTTRRFLLMLYQKPVKLCESVMANPLEERM